MMLATVFSLVARRSWLGYSSLHNLHSMRASMSTFDGGGGGQDGGVTIDYSEYTLVFDLDGTLVDSSASLQKAVNDFLLEEGYTGRTLTRKEVEPLMGDGINIVAARALQMVGLAARGDVGKTLDTMRNSLVRRLAHGTNKRLEFDTYVRETYALLSRSFTIRTSHVFLKATKLLQHLVRIAHLSK